MRLSGIIIAAALAALPAWAQIPTAPTAGSWNSGGTAPNTGGDQLPGAARQLDAGYKTAPGPFKTGSQDIVITDPVRSKELPIKVRFPIGAPGKLPVIIFSHGEGDSGEAFAELTDHWASYGYVVLLPTHADSAKIREQNGDKVTWTASSLWNSVRPSERMGDIVYMLDSITAIEGKVPELKPSEGMKLDRDRIGIAGHSAGALAAEIAIGVKTRIRSMDVPRYLGDRRIKAALVISAMGISSKGFTKESWNELDKPMLVVGGSDDVLDFMSETAASRREAFDLAKPGNKFLLFFQGATHWSYEGADAVSRMKENPHGSVDTIVQVTAAGTLAFWDAYLGSDDKTRAAGKAYLASDKLAAYSGLKAEIKHK